MPVNPGLLTDDEEMRVCRNCAAPPSCATETCPLERLRKVQTLEGQSGDLVAAASTYFLALLLGLHPGTVLERARRGELGPVRGWGKFTCVAVSTLLELDIIHLWKGSGENETDG